MGKTSQVVFDLFQPFCNCFWEIIHYGTLFPGFPSWILRNFKSGKIRMSCFAKKKKIATGSSSDRKFLIHSKFVTSQEKSSLRLNEQANTRASALFECCRKCKVCFHFDTPLFFRRHVTTAAAANNKIWRMSQNYFFFEGEAKFASTVDKPKDKFLLKLIVLWKGGAA